MMEEHVGAALAHALRHQIEVIVVQHHDSPAAAGLDLLGHHVGKLVVHRHVPVLERVALVTGDVGDVAEVPQVVLDEPEQRVGDDRIELVLHVGLDLEHADQVLAVELVGDRERLVAVLA